MIRENIAYPIGYNWLAEKKLIGFSKFSRLHPWYYLPKEKCFWATEKWPNVSAENLFVFAKRQDNDDLACFKVLKDGEVAGLYLIHGWTPNGFEMVQYFTSFWAWLHLVLQDVEECVEVMDENN